MSTKEMVVDTTVLVASLVPRDEHHAKAEPLFEGLRLGEIIFHCPTFGPVETCGVLMTREFGTQKFRLPLAVVKVAWDSLAKWIQESLSHKGSAKFHFPTCQPILAAPRALSPTKRE